MVADNIVFFMMPSKWKCLGNFTDKIDSNAHERRIIRYKGQVILVG